MRTKRDEGESDKKEKDVRKIGEKDGGSKGVLEVYLGV